jgi:hypothetical protein
MLILSESFEGNNRHEEAREGAGCDASEQGVGGCLTNERASRRRRVGLVETKM